jgi:hypothetical protein
MWRRSSRKFIQQKELSSRSKIEVYTKKNVVMKGWRMTDKKKGRNETTQQKFPNLSTAIMIPADSPLCERMSDSRNNNIDVCVRIF